MMHNARSLRELIDRFEAVIVDQYGVLHDGIKRYENALETLEELKRRGVPIVAVTNSGKRSKTNSDRLKRFGFGPHLFEAVLSSGEIAHRRLRALAPRTAVLVVARQGESELVEGLDLRCVPLGEMAELIVVASAEPQRYTRADYKEFLRPLARGQIPMLLANPDLLSATKSGTEYGPGMIALDYQNMGGDVETLGKPAKTVFSEALCALPGINAGNCLMIGDSPHHDIAGARDMGMKTLLIRSGIQSALDGIDADFVMDSLVW